MDFVQRLSEIKPDQETVLTIGVFDGVHLGHCHLLDEVINRAGKDYIPAVMTFTNHPATVINPGLQIKKLSTTEEKSRLISKQGIELIVPIPFDQELAAVSASNFSEALVNHLKIAGLVIGPDFALGKGREGNYNVLTQLGMKLGFWVGSVSPLIIDGLPVKSRRIRQDLAEGSITTVTKQLGRLFSISGSVITGNKQGRELGFPTANLSVSENMLLPGDGIYATWTTVNQHTYPSATSIGIRPTFGLTERVVESHILDFGQNIYGEHITVQFVEKIRDQETFDNLPALITQIAEDVSKARITLKDHGGSNFA